MLKLTTARASQAFALMFAACRRAAQACTRCNGAGEIRELYEAHLLTDDPRLVDSPSAHERREYLSLLGSRVEPMTRGAGVLRTPCSCCADLRVAMIAAHLAGAK